MPETRYIDEYDNGVLVNQIPYEVTDEQLAHEAESASLKQAETLINDISNLSEAKIFLWRLVKRLIKNGLIP